MDFKLRFMARNKKSVLNQVSEEPKKEIKEEVVESKSIVIDGALLAATLLKPVEKVEVLEEELPEVVFTNEPIEIDLLEKELEEELETEELEEELEAELEAEEEQVESYEEKLARFLNNKTSSPYRLYLRTGIIPKL